MAAAESPFEWLQSFFQSNCDGDWEHDHSGCSIQTMSDPGWKLTIDLNGTGYELCKLDELADLKAPISWLRCKIENGVYVAFCSPRRLGEAIGILRDVVEGRR